MIPRQPLVPNKQQLNPVMGSQFFVKYPKSDEKQSIVSYARPGKGAQGESVTGGKNSMTIIRKGRY
jgi:hypothetical protein